MPERFWRAVQPVLVLAMAARIYIHVARVALDAIERLGVAELVRK